MPIVIQLSQNSLSWKGPRGINSSYGVNGPYMDQTHNPGIIHIIL